MKSSLSHAAFAAVVVLAAPIDNVANLETVPGFDLTAQTRSLDTQGPIAATTLLEDVPTPAVDFLPLITATGIEELFAALPESTGVKVESAFLAFLSKAGLGDFQKRQGLIEVTRLDDEDLEIPTATNDISAVQTFAGILGEDPAAESVRPEPKTLIPNDPIPVEPVSVDPLPAPFPLDPFFDLDTEEDNDSLPGEEDPEEEDDSPSVFLPDEEKLSKKVRRWKGKGKLDEGKFMNLIGRSCKY